MDFYRRNARCLIAETNRNPDNYAPPFYRYEDKKCVQHLFRVASGLDSMVVGKSEIFGQAKKAYESARTSRASVHICIVYFNARFEWQNRYARTRTLRAARCRSVPSRSN